MKKAFLLCLVIVISHACFARSSYSAITSVDTAANIPSVADMLQQILRATGLQSNIELKESDVQNIEASVSHRKRYILYNPAYIKWITALTKDKWAAMALLAHEMGHHLNGHTIRKGGSSPQLELEADEFAGFILHQLGATLEQAQEVIKYISKTTGSATHPGRLSRMMAIEKGWKKAFAPAELVATSLPVASSL